MLQPTIRWNFAYVTQCCRSSAERDGSELMLEDIYSDDEIMPRDVNSSDDEDDEDDTNSDSSKGESDAQENKQVSLTFSYIIYFVMSF